MSSTTKRLALLMPRFDWLPVHSKKDPGGFAAGFQRNGLLVATIVNRLQDKGFAKNNGIRFYELAFSNYTPITALRIIGRTIRILRGIGPDIIFAYRWHVPYPSILAFLPLKMYFRKAKLVVKLDSDGSHLTKFSGLRRLLEVLDLYAVSLIADLIIVESSCGYVAFSGAVPIMRRRMMIIPNTVDKSAVVKANEISRREKVILSVGRISEDKGHDVLLRAFGLIHYKYPGWKVKVVGFLEDKAYYERLLQLIDGYNMRDKVEILPSVDEKTLKDLYAKSSIFCLCSRFESFGVARLEALVNGLYTIITEPGCGRDFRKYGAKVIPAGDVKAAAKALEEAITNIENGRYEPSEAKVPSYDDLARIIVLNLK